eukprot:CAMPEP_0183716566 /NCGR_PEP_ID=MMETSP0737-20130205/10436_1 /TAXON_ID=385413 /ORGANISM="Thalassiosira miniscula, Strain CCMP1093" /LENGTH=1583 /DNA_ID=CAMNT_0025945857 /DNA_START=119 /DNA_END=4870 /DNA_ORIENTATION=+
MAYNNNNNQQQRRRRRQPSTLALVSAYIVFGALHELAHLIAASYLGKGSQSSASSVSAEEESFASSSASSPLIGLGNGSNAVIIAARAILGRYSLVTIDDEDENNANSSARMILHAGWIFSLLLAIACHYLHASVRNQQVGKEKGSCEQRNIRQIGLVTIRNRLFRSPTLPLAAYITALEAIVTDLLGFTPRFNPYIQDTTRILCFCGNFGVLLLNPSWLNIDGGRTALGVLEKMVNVTMMRGAQSGGVVTFEPDHYTYAKHNKQQSSSPIVPPALHGIRSRVVNAKRTDLSKGVRRKVVKDNCTSALGGGGGNLRGWNKSEYNINNGAGKLVRGFFGHTRFATSSKASFDGTHPHQWSPRRTYNVYSFGSSSSVSNSSNSRTRPRSMGVENYITHNGDFEFYNVNGKYYDVEVVQQWLEKILETPMPATVDSAAIAGVIDLLRTQGSFALSVRYALCLTLQSSKVESDPAVSYPTMVEYTEIAKAFENSLNDLLDDNEDGDKSVGIYGSSKSMNPLENISSSEEKRSTLSLLVVEALRTNLEVVPAGATKKSNPTLLGDSSKRPRRGSHHAASYALTRLSKFVSTDVEDSDLANFVRSAVDAFFDNDLLHATRLFLQSAKGSFGLMVASSIDAHRQVCFAARGQTLSIGFYPRKGIICYGSEQAAVKAGLNYENPGGNLVHNTSGEADNAVRLDLDDLGGEICLLDWGFALDAEPAISPPNRNLVVEKLMNVNIVLLHQNQSQTSKPLPKRLTLLENNEFVKPLLGDCDDPVLKDIQDIPRICANIQEDWREVGLNRMTAWNLANCISARMKAIADGKIKRHGSSCDILVTGCEVSLWVAEQFVSDLQKCFPQLFVKAVSSNKLLGLFGQELAMPCIGFPYSEKAMDIKDPIVIIVSHSGGTFGPLACSNLLQSFSSSIFAVTSEWDTQVGKQLRSMYSDDLLSSRIFSTEVGVRPAEPCSVSVVATHQLLTNIFEHICVTIISDPKFSHAAGSIVTERDLQVLERCNQANIKALEEIVGIDQKGNEIHEKRSKTEKELRSAGDLWSEHILENVKAYIMSFVYVFGTVVSGFPLISGLAKAFGLSGSEDFFYVIRALDACIYFWLPQINITILRLFQGRNLRHRMVGRTVVVGDVPWVAQSAEAFLSKIFACSYSIAGLNVLSGNPADHLVHRHTHRVVRGSLLVCGRPDGRLPALTSLEASTCLSVNQASSIQSIGGTCESITIGHNKSKLPLSHRAIYLKSHRPLFLSEKILDSMDAQEDLVRQRREKLQEEKDRQKKGAFLSRIASHCRDMCRRGDGSILDLSLTRSRQAKRTRSSPSLLGAYVNLEREGRQKRTQDEDIEEAERVSNAIAHMIKERQGIENTRRMFAQIDANGDGTVSMEEFIEAYQKVDANISKEHLEQLFEEADINGNGTLSFDEFLRVSRMPNLLAELSIKNRDSRGLVQVQASQERYFGEELRKHSQLGVNSMAMSRSQHFSMELYESRIASLQRFVAMTVMFHQMGMRVQTFFPKISFGLFGYRMDRTHSIMRIATTASPVSGADVRERMEELRLILKIERSVQLISRTWKKWRLEKKNSVVG